MLSTPGLLKSIQAARADIKAGRIKPLKMPFDLGKKVWHPYFQKVRKGELTCAGSLQH